LVTYQHGEQGWIHWTGCLGTEVPVGPGAKPRRGSGDEVPQKLKHFDIYMWKLRPDRNKNFRAFLQ